MSPRDAKIFPSGTTGLCASNGMAVKTTPPTLSTLGSAKKCHDANNTSQTSTQNRRQQNKQTAGLSQHTDLTDIPNTFNDSPGLVRLATGNTRRPTYRTYTIHPDRATSAKSVRHIRTATRKSAACSIREDVASKNKNTCRQARRTRI